MIINHLMTYREIKKFIRQNVKHPSTHFKALKKNGEVYALINGEVHWFLEKDHWARILK